MVSSDEYKAIADHEHRLREHGCVVCKWEKNVYSAPTLHHRDGVEPEKLSGRLEAIPLCADCSVNPEYFDEALVTVLKMLYAPEATEGELALPWGYPPRVQARIDELMQLIARPKRWMGKSTNKRGANVLPKKESK